MNSERNRAKNFETKETSLLVELVQDNTQVLENKQSGAVSQKQKDLAWISLVKKFNARSATIPRTVNNLKDKWANLKKTAVRNYTNDKKYRSATGGGPSKKDSETPTQAIIKDILGERMTGMPAICDCDAGDRQDELPVESSSSCEVVAMEELVIDCSDVELIPPPLGFAADTPSSPMSASIQPASTSSADWADHTTAMLKSPPSKVLQVEKKGKKRIGGEITNTKWCDLADEKKMTTQLKQKAIVEENERRREMHDILKKHIIEEHEQKIGHREEEHQLKLRLMREEHEARWRYSSTLSYIHFIGKDPLRSLTLGTLLENAAAKYPERPAVISRHQNKSLTFMDVLNGADRFAAGLEQLGLKKGDRVGFLLPNQCEWHVVTMACMRIGLVLVTVNPGYQPPEVEYCIQKVGMKAIICGHRFKTQNYYEIMNVVAPEISQCEPGKLASKNVPSLKSVIILTDEHLKGIYSYQEVLDKGTAENILGIKKKQHLISPDDSCSIQFTSGTTGKPKAALFNHFNIVNNTFEIAKRAELNLKHHKLCGQVPLFHGYGTNISLFATYHFGTTLVVPGPSFNANESLDAIKEEKCTVINGTPTMYVDLVNVQTQRNEDISPEIALSGGAPCAPHLFQQMLTVLKLMKVMSLYGLTETTTVVFQSLPDDDDVEKCINTVGHVGDHVEVKIIDGEGNTVPMGQPGELCVRGYMNMLGYWNDEARTAEMIGRDRWLKTGDRFIINSDGYGKIVGRLRDMIIRGGENIFPKEIEDFLNTHPDVLEAHVIGLSHERLGEEVCACVRLKRGATLTKLQLDEFCRGKIAHFKIPSRLEIVEEFPKTASGKVQKFVLKQRLENC